MIYSRWLSLIILVALICLIVFYDKDKRSQKLKYFGMAFVEGMVGGFIIDYIGITAGYYYFPRQPYLGLSYFLIVIPCWGVFGLLINCLWNWVGKEKFIRGTAVTLFPLFALYEGSNLLTGSWVYTTPFYAIALGWLPLVWTFAGCNRRRKVVFKLEAWRQQFRAESFVHQVIRDGLMAARVLLTVAMFPLLIAIMIRICVELPTLIREEINVWSYTKYLLAMR